MSTNAGQQQVAIVTGASSGLGFGITRALLQRGFRVVGNSRTVSKSQELKPSADLVLVDGDIAPFLNGFTAAFPRRVFEKLDRSATGPRLGRALKVPA